MKMTIDEAIRERQKVIEVQEKLYEEASTNESKEIIKSVEWLTKLKEFEAKHWDECRQIAHYDNDIKSLKAWIADLKRCIKSLNRDYLTGYISALSAVEGMIDKMIGG